MGSVLAWEYAQVLRPTVVRVVQGETVLEATKWLKQHHLLYMFHCIEEMAEHKKGKVPQK